jgi:hypothetical protein
VVYNDEHGTKGLYFLRAEPTSHSSDLEKAGTCSWLHGQVGSVRVGTLNQFSHVVGESSPVEFQRYGAYRPLRDIHLIPLSRLLFFRGTSCDLWSAVPTRCEVPWGPGRGDRGDQRPDFRGVVRLLVFHCTRLTSVFSPGPRNICYIRSLWMPASM